jgi:hypothetical protein
MLLEDKQILDESKGNKAVRTYLNTFYNNNVKVRPLISWTSLTSQQIFLYFLQLA